MLKKLHIIRKAAMFSILLAVLFGSLNQRIHSRSWHAPLDVTIFPVNADGSLATHNYILGLQSSDFSDIDLWFSRQAADYQLGLQRPVRTSLGQVVDSTPPQYPVNANAIQVIWWGLRVRWWVRANTPDNIPNTRRIRVFVSYQQGQDGVALAHSVGLQKGLIGLVNAFADERQNEQNNVVIAHEVLHTVGATDKHGHYGQPLYPDGYANPARTPLYPQRYAEIMAGRIPTSGYSSYMPASLRSTKINLRTAHEIAWLDN